MFGPHIPEGVFSEAELNVLLEIYDTAQLILSLNTEAERDELAKRIISKAILIGIERDEILSTALNKLR
jgi:transcriptional regulator